MSQTYLPKYRGGIDDYAMIIYFVHPALILDCLSDLRVIAMKLLALTMSLMPGQAVASLGAPVLILLHRNYRPRCIPCLKA